MTDSEGDPVKRVSSICGDHIATQTVRPDEGHREPCIVVDELEQRKFRRSGTWRR